jgi:hypothetical protein
MSDFVALVILASIAGLSGLLASMASHFTLLNISVPTPWGTFEIHGEC